MPYMATPTVKTTYALDLETVQALANLARRWGVSKSEALRRVIRAAAGGTNSQTDAIAALDDLQRSLRLTPAKARSWARKARTVRREGSARGEMRGE
jgi:hypothetical protein